jgi:hypothetical protein
MTPAGILLPAEPGKFSLAPRQPLGLGFAMAAAPPNYVDTS